VLIGSVLVLAATLGYWAVSATPELRADLVSDAPTASQPPQVATSTTTSEELPTVTADSTVPRGPAFPQRIQIPSLGVDATVAAVGLETDGSMEVPGATEAGWYQYGSLPGATLGSAVIAAHVDYNRRPGVFFDLRKIATGDEVVIVDGAGDVHRYRVQERFQVDKEALPAGELFRTDGAPVLTLITCGGGYDKGTQSYEDNIVVRAVPI